MGEGLGKWWTGALLPSATIAALIATGCGHAAPVPVAAADAGAKLVKPVAMTINSGSSQSDGEGTFRHPARRPAQILRNRPNLSRRESPSG